MLTLHCVQLSEVRRPLDPPSKSIPKNATVPKKREKKASKATDNSTGSSSDQTTLFASRITIINGANIAGLRQSWTDLRPKYPRHMPATKPSPSHGNNEYGFLLGMNG